MITATLRSRAEMFRGHLRAIREALHDSSPYTARVVAEIEEEFEVLYRDMPRGGMDGPDGAQGEPATGPRAPIETKARPYQNTQPATAAKVARKNPSPYLRICDVCDQTLSITEFSWKNKDKGWRRSTCKTCFNAYRRERYLTVERARMLGNTLRFTLLDEDPCIGDACPICRGALAVGQRVVAADVALVHEGCAS